MTLDEIATACCKVAGCTRREMFSKSRCKSARRARAIAVALCKKHRRMSSAEIGTWLGRCFSNYRGWYRVSDGDLAEALAFIEQPSLEKDIARMTPGLVVAAIQQREDIRIAVGCYIGQALGKAP